MSRELSDRKNDREKKIEGYYKEKLKAIKSSDKNQDLSEIIRLIPNEMKLSNEIHKLIKEILSHRCRLKGMDDIYTKKTFAVAFHYDSNHISNKLCLFQLPIDLWFACFSLFE